MNTEPVTDAAVCHTCSKYRWPFARQSFTFTGDRACQALPVTVREDRKKLKTKLMYKNSPRYNGTPHRKCHSSPVCWGAGHSGVTTGSSYILSCLQSLLLSSPARDGFQWQLTQPRARHAGYIWALECHQEIVRISSLRVQSQSHLNLKDKHSPCAALLPRSAGNTGRRIKRSLPVSGFIRTPQRKEMKTRSRNTNREMGRDTSRERGDDVVVDNG